METIPIITYLVIPCFLYAKLINFKSKISATLDKMVSGFGISGYKIVRDTEHEKATEKASRKTMYLYDIKGLMVSSCTVYKGEFDGHSWYVFYGNLSSPSVVHDPLCNCTKK